MINIPYVFVYIQKCVLLLFYEYFFMVFPSFIYALKLDENHITSYLISIPPLSQNIARERFLYKIIDKLGYRKVEKSQYP